MRSRRDSVHNRESLCCCPRLCLPGMGRIGGAGAPVGVIVVHNISTLCQPAHMSEPAAMAAARRAMRLQAESVAEQITSAIAAADQSGASEEYLKDGASALVQALRGAD